MAVLTVLMPLMAMGACLAIILLFSVFRQDKPLRPERMGLLSKQEEDHILSNKIMHLAAGCLLAGMAVLTAQNPVLAMGACLIIILLLSAVCQDEPLRPVRMGLMIIAIAIPLAGPGTYFANHMDSANLTVSKTIGFVALAYLIWVKAASGEPFASVRQNKQLLCFAGIIMLSYFVNDKDSNSINTLWGYATAMLTFFLCINTLTRPQHIATLLVVLMVGYLISIGMGVCGLSSTFEPDNLRQILSANRFRGASAGNAVGFGMGTATCFLLAVYHATSRNGKIRLLALIAASVFLYGTVTTFARSAYLSSLVGLLLIAYLLRSRIRPFHFFAGIVLIAMLTAPVIDLVAFYSRIAQIFADPAIDHSYLRRISYHFIGYDLWIKSPVIGIGPGRFNLIFADETFRFYADTFSTAGRTLHNMYLSTLCHTGIAGLTALVLIIATCVKDLIYVRCNAHPDDHETGDYAGMLLVALAAVLLVAAVGPTDDSKLIWILLGSAAALRNIHDQSAGDNPDAGP